MKIGSGPVLAHGPACQPCSNAFRETLCYVTSAVFSAGVVTQKILCCPCLQGTFHSDGENVSCLKTYQYYKTESN